MDCASDIAKLEKIGQTNQPYAKTQADDSCLDFFYSPEAVSHANRRAAVTTREEVSSKEGKLPPYSFSSRTPLPRLPSILHFMVPPVCSPNLTYRRVLSDPCWSDLIPNPCGCPCPRKSKIPTRLNRSGRAAALPSSCEPETPPTSEPPSRRCTLQSQKVRLGSLSAGDRESGETGRTLWDDQVPRGDEKGRPKRTSLFGQIARLDDSILVGRSPDAILYACTVQS